MTRVSQVFRIGLVLSLILLATVAHARINKSLVDTRLAAITLTSKMDLDAINQVGGIVDRVVGLRAEAYLTEAAFRELELRGLAVEWIPDLGRQAGLELWERTRD
ncbi:hypothetical protein KKH27_12840, partial [bacterium]|nr:hypothetical protein [bacterium]MBU1983251.1 hypothetical protein [bacterium]